MRLPWFSSPPLLPYPHWFLSLSLLPYPCLSPSPPLLPYPHWFLSLSLLPYPCLSPSPPFLPYPHWFLSLSLLPYPCLSPSPPFLPYPRRSPSPPPSLLSSLVPQILPFFLILVGSPFFPPLIHATLPLTLSPLLYCRTMNCMKSS